MSILDRSFEDDNYLPELKAKMAIGGEFKTWIGSDVGRYIVTRIEQEELKTLRDLSKCDPSDTNLVIALQERATMFTTILRWIEQAIEEGATAKYQLRQMEISEKEY